MGKPQLSRRSSTQSVSTSKSNMNVTSQKSTRAKRKRRQKTENTIKKLFNQLRRDSKCSLTHSQSGVTSVIEIDDSILNTTVVNPNISIEVVAPAVNLTDVQSGNMTDVRPNVTDVRMTVNKPGSSNTIVIKDDEPCSSTPRKNVYSLHHSTPIKKPSIDELILSANNQLIEDSNNNRTREINASSFLTIDLTTDSGFNRSTQPTIIDLDCTNDQHDCVLTSVSQGSSMSGDSDVTVLRRPGRSTRRLPRDLVNLNASQKDMILAFLSEKVFNGCSTPARIQRRAPETAEDTYIKEVIVGKKLSRNSIGSNVYNPEKYVNTTGLRMVVIDGSNVAMAHGSHRIFSVQGLKIVIDFFLSRGHAVKAFVPRFRNKMGRSTLPQLLMQLERQGHVIFTPSREVQGRDITSYDDRYIIQCAAEFDGVIVSNDGYKDLINENPRWAFVIKNRVLQFNWVNGMIMFPRDPLGRNGPTLEQFLKMPQKM